MFDNKIRINYSTDPWVKGTGKVLTESGEVHVWKANLKASEEEFLECWQILSTEEKDRAKRFYFRKDKINFVKSRATLRILLGNYLSLDPKGITLQYTEFGKPFIENVSLQFNVSHNSACGLFAFTLNNLIGVDIEKIKPDIEFEKLVARFFSEQEANTILGLTKAKQAEAFFKCWTRKEAFIKAHGEGLSLPLDQFEVSILEDEEVRLKTVNWKQEVAENWSMVSFEPEEGRVGAIAVKGKIEKVLFLK